MPRKPAKEKGPAKAGPEPLSRPDIEDGQLEYLERLAKYGDLDASRLLHGTLARHLRSGELTEPMIEMLASMHEAIAAGTDVQAAMHCQLPPNRRINRTHQEKVYSHVADMVAYFDLADAYRKRMAKRGLTLPNRQPLAEIYRQIAQVYGLSESRVKSIYLKLRAEIENCEQ